MTQTFSVMCIEDNTQLVDALEQRLRMEHDFGEIHRVRDFTRLAVEAEMNRPTLILLDLDLPGSIDGLDVLDELVRTVPEARVIIFTGNPRDSLATSAMARGAWGYVSKGVPPERLLRALRDVLAGDAVVLFDD